MPRVPGAAQGICLCMPLGRAGRGEGARWGRGRALIWICKSHMLLLRPEGRGGFIGRWLGPVSAAGCMPGCSLGRSRNKVWDAAVNLHQRKSGMDNASALPEGIETCDCQLFRSALRTPTCCHCPSSLGGALAESQCYPADDVTLPPMHDPSHVPASLVPALLRCHNRRSGV